MGQNGNNNVVRYIRNMLLFKLALFLPVILIMSLGIRGGSFIMKFVAISIPFFLPSILWLGAVLVIRNQKITFYIWLGAFAILAQLSRIDAIRLAYLDFIFGIFR